MCTRTCACTRPVLAPSPRPLALQVVRKNATPAKLRSLLLDLPERVGPESCGGAGGAGASTEALKRQQRSQRSARSAPSATSSGGGSKAASARGSTDAGVFGSCAQGRLRGVSGVTPIGAAASADNNWGKLAQFEAAAFIEERQMARQAAREQVREQRRFLDQQRESAAQEREATRRRAQLEAEDMLEEVRKWGEDQRSKQAKASEHNRHVKDLITSQRTERLRRQAQDKARRKAEEAAEVIEVEKALQAERVRKEKRREDKLREMISMRAENEERLAARREADVREKERDVAMAAAYEAMLDKQEKDRSDRLRAQAERVQKLMDLGSSAVRDKAARDEAQDKWIADGAADQLKREQERERARLEKARLATIEQMKGLNKQMEEKRKIAEENARTEAFWKQEVMRQDESDRRKEETKKEMRRRAALRNRADIEAQIAEANRRVAQEKIAMTDTEKALNSALLEAAALVAGE